MNLKEIRKSEIDLLHLIIVLPVTLLITWGVFFIFLIIAWENFGEGANSKLYSHWTSLGIYTATFLVMQIVISYCIRAQVDKENLRRAKSYLLANMMVIFLYVLMLCSLYI